MYKWVDEKGVTHYSETPPPGRKAAPVPGAPTPAPKPADAPSTWGEKDRDFRRRQIEREQAQEQRQKKENEEKRRVAMRREMCLEARHALALLREQRPIYWINEKGEREFLEDRDRPAAIERMKKNIESYCTPE
jgi:hypothetical protein